MLGAMSEDGQFDAHGLMSLARDRSVAARTTLAETVTDLFFGSGEQLSDRERALMSDILRQLIHDVEMSVRKLLAERLAGEPTAPHELIVTLANDEIEVAHPVLVESEVLQDPELIEIIRHRTQEHQLAITMRRYISEDVATALVEAGHEDVIKSLLENGNAQIARQTMEHLVEQSRRVDSYQNPLVHRKELTPDLAQKMYWWVSAALRKHILAHYEIDPDALDNAIEDSVKDGLDKQAAENEGAATTELADSLIQDRSVDQQMLVGLLRQGEVALFEALFSRLTGLRQNLVRRLIYEPGGEGLAVACRAAAVDKSVFASLFVLSRNARPSGAVMAPDELSKAMRLFARVTPEAATRILERWRRDPQYLNVLRLLEEESPGA